MVALHPFNTNRWNASSWRDTLISFAEENQLILLCPDGGEDGKVDDPKDTVFTTKLIDAALEWYNVNPRKVFLMGFSWGGRTTYSYGLNHANRFAGFIPIGAAVQGAEGLEGKFEMANDKPFYILHGSNDAPDSRFYPLRDSLVEAGAYLQWQELKGVGHTIDFPNRNRRLTKAFQWVDSVSNIMVPPPTLSTDVEGSVATVVETPKIREGLISAFPERVRAGQKIRVDYLISTPGTLEYSIHDVSGKKISGDSKKVGKGTQQLIIDTTNIPWGVYEVRFYSPRVKKIRKLTIRG